MLITLKYIIATYFDTKLSIFAATEEGAEGPPMGLALQPSAGSELEGDTECSKLLDIHI